MASTTGKREASSLTACIAYVLGVDPAEVPGDGGVGLHQWLAQRNLGLVPVAAPETLDAAFVLAARWMLERTSLHV